MRPRWRPAPPRARFRTGRRERRDATGVGGRGRIMTEVEARTFLDRFPAEELAARRVLNGDTRLLNNRSVTPLIELMAEHDVSRLVAPGRDWFLDADGTFRNPRSVEATSGNVESLRNPGNVFNEQNTSLNPHYARAQGPDAEDAGDVTFGLERDLQRALRENIGQLESGLEVVDGGTERIVDAGRIDITAKAPDGALVVIELKAGRADLRAIGQILSYMGTASPDPGRAVRGILVAGEFDPRAVMAAGAVPNLALRVYSFQFVFGEP